VNERFEQILNAIAGAKVEHPELGQLLDLYRALYTVQFQLRPEATVGDTQCASAPYRQRLDSGQRALTFDDLRVAPGALHAAAAEIADLLAGYDEEWAGVGEDVRAMASDDLLAMAQDCFEGGPSRSGEREERLTYALRLALAPFLQTAAESATPCVDLHVWYAGHCPMCGAVPDLALVSEEGGRRDLVCSWCDTRWPYVRLKCPFCDNVDPALMPYYPLDDKAYRLYVCRACNHYLKTVDLREARRVVLPPVERILTAPLDVAAWQEGYTAV